MPKYTITTDNGDGAQRTDEALEFRDTKAATDDAQAALSDIAHEKLPDGKHAAFDVSVQDDTGKEVYRAGLVFTAKDQADLDQDAEADAAADDVASSLGGAWVARVIEERHRCGSRLMLPKPSIPRARLRTETA